MRIGGLQRFSMVDYPGKLSAIIFTQGCNFRCPYCHNPELVEPSLFIEPMDELAIMNFLRSRTNRLDAVTITGGEPTLHHDLDELLGAIKELGYLTKLDTNGSNPHMIDKLLSYKLVDYIAMDIKAPLEKYSLVCGIVADTESIKSSMELIKNSGIDYEFRTTFPAMILGKEDLLEIAYTLGKSRRFFVQKCHHDKNLDNSINYKTSLSDVPLNLLNNFNYTELEEFSIR